MLVQHCLAVLEHGKIGSRLHFKSLSPVNKQRSQPVRLLHDVGQNKVPLLLSAITLSLCAIGQSHHSEARADICLHCPCQALQGQVLLGPGQISWRGMREGQEASSRVKRKWASGGKSALPDLSTPISRHEAVQVAIGDALRIESIWRHQRAEHTSTLVEQSWMAIAFLNCMWHKLEYHHADFLIRIRDLEHSAEEFSDALRAIDVHRDVCAGMAARACCADGAHEARQAQQAIRCDAGDENAEDFGGAHGREGTQLPLQVVT
mmetsp:Transcript_20365/g.56740  ORF Transcript_20365/g.56740 Transcript_20365/m.56740 type:complete len:263 (+) Transcript_20365:812-1600(+)